MRRLRIVLLILVALLSAPTLVPAHAQAQANAPSQAPAAVTAAPASAGLPAYTAPPRTLRAYWHVFAAFAIAWVLLFGYVVSLARKFRRVEDQLNGLARA